MSEVKPEVLTKKVFKLIFLTVFLDIAGFAVIFPLIPQLTAYYTANDAQNFLLQAFWSTVGELTQLSGDTMVDTKRLVMFGCLLGSIYSALQFLAAPIWGKLSDQWGRKKILRFTMLGMILSYVLWVFSGNFTLLVIARLIGGLSSGNISVASAVIADVTDRKNRSSGMAFIGIALALGFVFGPALGGILSQVNLLEHYSSGHTFALNPFSAPALIALILSVINWVLMECWLPETRWKTKAAPEQYRTSNLFTIFKPHANSTINRINAVYFIFITLFAGMEFTLTFLTVERLDFSPKANGMMFVYIGLMIALVQGGFVRRRAAQIGEKKVALMGLITLVPGLVLLAYSHSITLLLSGLFFLAAGSAMSIPTLTSLLSLHAGEEEQGHVLGIFRSLGALGRIIGPLWASLLFWRCGSQFSYVTGAVVLALPMFLLGKIQTNKA